MNRLPHNRHQLLQRQRGNKRKMIAAFNAERTHVGSVQSLGEKHMVENDARPRQPCWERGMTALRLAQGSILESRIQQLAEAG